MRDSSTPLGMTELFNRARQPQNIARQWGAAAGKHGDRAPWLQLHPDFLSLTSEDDVLFRPGVDLLTMRARYLAALDFGSLPQLFLNCLPARGQLRR